MTEDTTPELTMSEAKFALARLLLQTLQQFEAANPDVIVTDVDVQRVDYGLANRLHSVTVTVEVR